MNTIGISSRLQIGKKEPNRNFRAAEFNISIEKNVLEELNSRLDQEEERINKLKGMSFVDRGTKRKKNERE